MKLTPPTPKQVAHRREHHGRTFTDHYEWLRDRESADTRAYLEAENAYTAARTKHLETARQTLFEQIVARTKEDARSLPTRSHGHWYYSRIEPGAQYSVHARIPVRDEQDWTPPVIGTEAPAGEQVLLDGNVEAEGHDFFSLGALDVPRHRDLVLFAVDLEGDEHYTVRVRDLATGPLLDDRIDDTTGTAFFTPDGAAIVYQRPDEAWRPDSVWLHRLGEPTERDSRLFVDDDERHWVSAGLTASERFIVISADSKVSSETRIIDLEGEDLEPRVLLPRRTDRDVEYDVEHVVRASGDDAWFVVHNARHVNGELALLPHENRGAAAWEHLEGIVEPQDDRRINGVEVLRRAAALEYRAGGLARVAWLREGEGSFEVDPIEFDGPLSTVYLAGAGDLDQPYLRVTHSSLVEPTRVYDVFIDGGERELRKSQEVEGGYDPSDYVEERDWATADDGTRIPLSIVRHRHVSPEAPAPTLIYGYGSYEASMDPALRTTRLPLLDAGVVYVIAHVRGGGEMGRLWYDEGKLERKTTTFTDFLAAARHLIDTGRTTPDRLVAEGGSAGGLLMGAIVNLAPELFAGVHLAVPFVDPLTSMLMPELPLTVVEWDEWGDPLHDPAVYDLMASYSPYENLDPAATLPRLLITTSFNDTRVLYVEPAKYLARLREGECDAMMKCEMVAGHGGVSGRYSAWRDRAFELAWMLDVLGVEPSPTAPRRAPGSETASD